MPKEIWDLSDSQITVDGITEMMEKCNKGAFTNVDIHNVSMEDLAMLRTLLEFYHKLNGKLQDIRKAIEVLGGKR